MFMKAILKRYKWDIILFGSIYLVSMFTLYIVNRYERIHQTLNQSSDTLNDISIHFIIDDYQIVDFSFLKDEESSFALLQRKSEALPVFSVIYARDYFDVSEGRTFTDGDFSDNNLYMLCGSNAEEIIQVDPFVFYGVEYSLIGKLSDKNTFESKYAIFLTNGDIKECSGITEFILVGFSQKKLEQVYTHITEKLEDRDTIVKRIEIKSTKVGDVFNVTDVGLKVGSLVLLFDCVTILLMVYFWLDQFEEMYLVYYLFGIKGFWRRILKKFFIILFLGYILAFLWKRTDYWLTAIYLFEIMGVLVFAILIGEILYKKKGDWNEKNFGRNPF